MKSFAAIIGLAAVAAAQNSSTTYVTDIVLIPCPSATILTTFGKTYTVTAATTLTITDCPCTVTKPMTQGMSTVLYSSCPGTITTPAMPNKTPVAPPATTYTNPLTVIYNSAPGGGSSGGSSAGGSSAGGSQAGGSQAGGSQAGGSSAGGSPAQGGQAGGAPAGGSSANGYAQATGTSAPYSTFSGAAMANKVGMGALGAAAALVALPFAL